MPQNHVNRGTLYSWQSSLLCCLQNEQLGFWNTLWVMLLDIYVVLTGPERRAVRMALWLAFFDQGCASTAIINYAPQVLEMAGIRDYSDATLWSSAITAAKVHLTPERKEKNRKDKTRQDYTFLVII